MKRMKALKHLYTAGELKEPGEHYVTDDITARKHVRSRMAEYAPHPFARTVGENRKRKPAGPTQTKGANRNVSEP